MKERLISLLKKADAYASGVCTDYDEAQEVCADYLLAEGVIVPPCKIGDIVYAINKSYSKCKHIGQRYDEDLCAGCECEDCDSKEVYTIKEEKVLAIAFYKSGIFVKTEQDVFNFKRISSDFRRFTTVFLTKEEAEKALAEGRAENAN